MTNKEFIQLCKLSGYEIDEYSDRIDVYKKHPETKTGCISTRYVTVYTNRPNKIHTPHDFYLGKHAKILEKALMLANTPINLRQ